MRASTVVKVLVEASGVDSGFHIVVEAVKVHEEALRMEITAEWKQ
jgi:hypothetical protein